MKLKNVKLTGGVDGGRGWKGDAENMLLNIGKLETLKRVETQTQQPTNHNKNSQTSDSLTYNLFFFPIFKT
jgi:hypothetical protein